MLHDGDAAPLVCLLEIWGVRSNPNAPAEAVQAELAEAMIEPARVDRVIAMLSDEQRGALQMILKARDGFMLEPFFRATHGDIRELGEGAIKREQPHLTPKTNAEALYYRGLVGRTFDIQGDGSARRVVYVPTDLASLLVGMPTAYDDAAAQASADAGELIVEPLPDMPASQTADTSLVDDMTTLLAFIQIEAPKMAGRLLDPEAAAALLPHLLHTHLSRLAFLIQLAWSAELIESQEERAYIKRAEARRWLSAPRAQQVKMLAESWRDSRVIVDLWMTPGLRIEHRAGSMPNYDGLAARKAALALIGQHVPPEAWWLRDDLIHVVQQTRPDFQRQNFDTWYIRDEAGGDLSGERHWEDVEGRLLEYLITGPMHWLGLVDLAEDAARLTAYGRGFLGLAAFPNPADPPDQIAIDEEGRLAISRRIARIDRFTAARFSEWLETAHLAENTPYRYRITLNSLETAKKQGIAPDQIAAFLQRTCGGVPDGVAHLLKLFTMAPVSSATVEAMWVLRTTSKAALDLLYETPALRRFFGARLGDLAAALRADTLEQAAAAFREYGIKLDVIER
jgi:hypothetical protein